MIKTTRKSWDEYFLDVAEQASTRGTCDRLHVGCVIVKNKKIISTGYNGSAPGDLHCDEVGHLYNDEGRCIRTIHAEQNALLVAETNLEGATVYVTHEPCENCTKLMRIKGIKRVVFRNAYNNKYNQHFVGDMEWVHVPQQKYVEICISKSMTLNEIQSPEWREHLIQRKKAIHDIVVLLNTFRRISKVNRNQCKYTQNEECLLIRLEDTAKELEKEIMRIASNNGKTIKQISRKEIMI